MIIRVLALKNVNVISKDFLTFYGSKTFASENCKLCYSTILTLELYCSSILKIYIYIYIYFIPKCYCWNQIINWKKVMIEKK